MSDKVRLYDVINQVKIPIAIDKAKEYKLVTISKTGTIKLREIARGFEIAAEKAFLARAGAFIYSRLAIHTGAFGIIPPNLDGAVVTSEMPSFEFKKNILPEFLIYSLQHPSFQFQLRQLTKGMGRTRVKESAFLNLLIDLPSVCEQERIIKSISSLELQNELMSREYFYELSIIKKLRSAFLREAMQGLLVKQSNSEGNASSLLEKIKDEKGKLISEKKAKREKILAPIMKEDIPFNIPPNWSWCRLGNLVAMGRGRFSIRPRNDPRYFNGRYPFIQIGSLSEMGDVINSAPQTLNEEGFKVSKEFPKGTIAIAIVGGTIGNLGVLGIPMCFTDSMVGIYPSSNYNQVFILNFLRWVQPQIKRAAYQMSGQPNIKIPNLTGLVMPLPPLDEQHRIVKKLEELMKLCDELEASIKQSKEQTNLLLQSSLREALMEKERAVAL